MHVSVQKYGGTSLADMACLEQVADRLAAARQAGQQIVAVVSAMGSATDELLGLAGKIGPDAHGRELDALLSTGECTSAALLALAVQQRGVRACSLTGAEAGIVTDRAFGRAQIIDIDPSRIHRELDQGRVVVVAGFQGTAQETGCTTTLGRGGSDATAAALAAALHASECEIGTDVDGIYTADPRHVPGARKLDSIGYEQMLELTKGGAKVLMPRCVDYARRHGVALHVRSTGGVGEGSWVLGTPPESTVDSLSERPSVVGLAHLACQVQYTVTGVPDQPESLVAVFAVLLDAAVEEDMATWTRSATHAGALDVSFVAPEQDHPRIEAALEAARTSAGRPGLERSEPFGRLTVVGTRLRSDATVLPTILRTMAGRGIEVTKAEINDSRIAISCPDSQLIEALVVAHDAFGLGGNERARDAAGMPGRRPSGPVLTGDGDDHG